jgi:hypothetical protein
MGATTSKGFAFNPFTGNFDIATTDVITDTLTSTNATFVLSDDGTDLSLTGDLGDMNFVNPTTDGEIRFSVATGGVANDFLTIGGAEGTFRLNASDQGLVQINGLFGLLGDAVTSGSIASLFAVNPTVSGAASNVAAFLTQMVPDIDSAISCFFFNPRL